MLPAFQEVRKQVTDLPEANWGILRKMCLYLDFLARAAKVCVFIGVQQFPQIKIDLEQLFQE